MPKKLKISVQGGMITPTLLVLLAIFFVFAITIMSWSLQERKDVLRESRNTKALQLAEAGVDYYKWHLSHDENDHKDGHTWCCGDDDGDGVGDDALTLEDCGGVCGPYTTEYRNCNDVAIGKYSLMITPPSLGSTVVGVESTGWVYEDNSVKKVVTSQLGKKSLARYSFLSNSSIWIGEGESTSGPFHSNKGIRFDGDCNASVTNASPDYLYRDYDEDDNIIYVLHDGIWGLAEDDPCGQYWNYPDSPVDFSLFTVDMASIKKKAEDYGIYLPQFNRSVFHPGRGYKIVFRDDGKVEVTAIRSFFTYDYYDGGWKTDDEEINKLWPTTEEVYDLPENGLIFAQDDVWVEGTVKGKVTVVAANLELTRPNFAKITINDNITYFVPDGYPDDYRDGNSSLGLMAEGNVLVPGYSPTNLRIDAVMLSQNEHVYRRNYGGEVNGGGLLNKITVYGGIITNKLWTWSYSYNNILYDGYTFTETIYDNHLTYGPPPSFPTDENFDVLSWSEKK